MSDIIRDVLESSWCKIDSKLQDLHKQRRDLMCRLDDLNEEIAITTESKICLEQYAIDNMMPAFKHPRSINAMYEPEEKKPF